VKLGAGIVVAAALAIAPAPGAEVPARQWSEIARLAPKALLLDAAATEERLVAVGERGIILVSRDHGASWQQARVPTRALLTGVWMHDSLRGWAVGHDETILRTVDGGGSWELVHSDPQAERPLLDVRFSDANDGCAVGAYGAFLVTHDGGSTWSDRPIGPDDFHLNQIAADARGTLYIAAEAGHIYRSSDGGVTWTGLPTPYDGSFFGVLPLSDGAVLVFGLRGRLFRSEDGGAHWSEIGTGTEATLMSGIEQPGGRVTIAGLAGALLVSDDGAHHFRYEPLADRKAGVALIADSTGLLLFGEGGSRRLGGEP
jgi:photosystem II stability/assembly factor-like uncharacterized protein